MHQAGGAEIQAPAPAAPVERNGRRSIRQARRGSQSLRLVTAVFHSRIEADDAIRWLIAQKIPGQDIYVGPPSPSAEAGRKSGEVGGPRKEPLAFHARVNPAPWTGLQMGLIMGGTGGFLLGLGVGFSAWVMDRVYDLPAGLSSLLENPLWSVGGGVIIGLMAGALIARLVAWSLAWLKTRPPLSGEETTVTVRCAAETLELVSSALLRSQAHQLNVSNPAAS
jgi:hypothetical protein